MNNKHKINNFIKVPEIRVIGSSGENLGVISLDEALGQAKKEGLDLVEISPNTNPPIAKIVDYGKFLYAENKKQKSVKSKIHTVEVKNIQIKVGTGEHDLNLKAKKASQWLGENNRVRIDLFLPGRTKFMNETFLKERMDRVFKLISIDFRIAEDIKKSAKGLTVLIEKAK